MTENAVELNNIAKTFVGRPDDKGDVQAVEQVDLSIRQGEFFTLLGPSGCGKTTTLRMIGGFEAPTRGQVLIKGRDMTNIPPHQRPVNTVFQDYALFPHMNILQNVAFGLTVNRVARTEREDRAREALQLVRLSGLETRMPSQLSGGQQQRVALARALVNKPAVLLLDEPLGALDLKLRKTMQLELKHLQHQVGITFIYVTHDQEEALTMSDRIAVMNHGRVLQVGDPYTIYESPETQFVADFIGETNFLNVQVIDTDISRTRIKVCGHDLEIVNAGEIIEIGSKRVIAIRPEKLVLSPDRSSLAHISGIIREVVYIGTDTRYGISLPENETVFARVSNVHSGDRQTYQTNQQVFVGWQNQDARLLVADGI